MMHTYACSVEKEDLFLREILLDKKEENALQENNIFYFILVAQKALVPSQSHP